MEKFDFCGWATKANLKCSDGRTIMKDAFKHNDGRKVPLVWNHQHDNPHEVLGHALLENREEGVYAYCKFNDTETARTAKLLVQHGDISALSIYANQLKQQGGYVSHGEIRELSLVLAGANPGAFIDTILAHGEESDEEAIIYTGEYISLYHADEAEKKEEQPKQEEKKEEAKPVAKEKTIGDVLEELTEEQMNAVYALVGTALEANEETDEEDEESEGGNETMKHNVFDQDEQQQSNVLSHSDMQTILTNAKRYGSLRESFLAHTESSADHLETYGIKGVTDEWLFPEARNLNNPPDFIKRDTGWVSKVMGSVHHTPFSRIKSMFADITEEDARAKGYIKGSLKKEEVFHLLRRTTTPTTIYKKQKMDRDDLIDITDFDVVAWLKAEMRMMLDEEIARAVIVGDNRSLVSPDKIDEQHIRPIWTDEDLYTIKSVVNLPVGATADEKAKAFIRATVKSRKDYKGSGNPVLLTTEDWLTDCLLMEDSIGRIIYDSVDKLKSALRVSDIITVPVMEGLTRTDADGKTRHLLGIVVNFKDYNIGADKGGAVSMFEDFDIDYNAEKYLIETRCSGALIKPYAAIAIEMIETPAAG